MAQRKKVIRAEPEFEGVVFGIITQLKDYQLCWHLNKTLGLEMKMMDDLEISNKKKNKTSVSSWFKYEDDLDKCRMYLISNKHSGDYYISEMKQADFIFLVQGELSEKKSEEISEAIKQIQAVQMMIQINPAKIKSAENLLIE